MLPRGRILVPQRGIGLTCAGSDTAVDSKRGEKSHLPTAEAGTHRMSAERCLLAALGNCEALGAMVEGGFGFAGGEFALGGEGGGGGRCGGEGRLWGGGGGVGLGEV